jgi:hypothetical protein
LPVADAWLANWPVDFAFSSARTEIKRKCINETNNTKSLKTVSRCNGVPADLHWSWTTSTLTLLRMEVYFCHQNLNAKNYWLF